MSTDAPPFAGRSSRIGPSLNRLIARRAEIDAARRALRGTRLMTFTGPGGVGKTRLALEVAHRARADFDSGSHLVRLDHLTMHANAGDVQAAILAALGVNDQSANHAEDRLVNYLQSRRLLIVLDNCEHVTSPAADVVRTVLSHAPEVKVVTTSRQPLGVDGETVRLVTPLSVPGADIPPTPIDLATDSSVCLLLERARETNPDFALTGENAAAVAQLCRLLEGIPLAIELAAAKLRSLTVTQILERFGTSLTSLASSDAADSRHGSLRSMVEWSYELCPPDAKILWRRLSVFTSAFDLNLAEDVCAFGSLPREDIYDCIDRLVGQSILLAESNGSVMRYRTLAPVREFMAELAEQAGETDQLRRRHRDLMLHRATDVVNRWCGPDQATHVARMRTDHTDHVSAMLWSAATPGEEESGLLLAARLRYHWLTGGYLADGRERLDTMLAVTDQPTALRGEALWVVTWLTLVQGDHQAASGRLTELADLAEYLDDDGLRIHVRHWSGLLAMFTGRPDEAIAEFEAARIGHHRNGDLGLELTADFMMAAALVCGGDPDRAIEVASQAMTLSGAFGDTSFRAYELWASGLAHWVRGDLDDAEEAIVSALRIERSFADGFCVALSINVLASIAYGRNRPRQSARLLAAADHVWGTLGTSIRAFGPHLTSFYDECKRQLSAHHLENAQPAVPSPTDINWAIELALGPKSDSHDTGGEDRGPLTPREFEVARLVATGLSNREIAEQLVVSKRTVDGHVERALSKLGFSSRAQIAAWIVRRPPVT